MSFLIALAIIALLLLAWSLAFAVFFKLAVVILAVVVLAHLLQHRG